MMTRDAAITGSGGHPIRVSTHLPASDARFVALIAHGFLGYKDYGFLPALGERVAALGGVVHRFNFSHSGIGADPRTFEHPELFEADTWSKQVFDLGALDRAIDGGELPGAGVARVLIGHSRGGTTCVLGAGRGVVEPDALITLASPSVCCSLSDSDRRTLLDAGSLERPSNRTGQVLRVGGVWLREQLDDPGAHDPLALAGRIRCPALVVHGRADPTVPPEHAVALSGSLARARLELLDGADHVFNTPNPHPVSHAHPPELRRALDLVGDFVTNLAF